jgi:signal transduction histidine kinase
VILSKIVTATDQLRKARESGAAAAEVEAAQQTRREAMQEARQFLRGHPAASA